MSTELATLNGQREYTANSLYLTSFYGGERRGKCLQLTISPGDYTQLTSSEVEKLRDKLNEFLQS